MGESLNISKFKNSRLIAILSLAALLLLTPLVAMLFTPEVNWTPADFMVAGLLLFGTGLICEMVLRKVRNARYRAIICTIVLIMLLLVWAELAVGIV